MKKFYCDRCGEEITEALRISPLYLGTTSIEMAKKLFLLTQPIEKMDFCESCLQEIVSFARNKNTCDECVQQMMDENAMLREEDEKAGSGNSEPDPGQFTAGADRVETGRPCIKYIASCGKVAEAMRSIRRERQCQSGLS